MDDEKRESHLPAIASGALIDIAEQAERRVAAIIKIKKVALMVTNRYDWTNQQDKPYLMVSGSEKIANLFNISWRIDEPRFEVEEDGHFTYTFKGEFSLADRTVEVEGSRSSKDPFFKKYDWIEDADGKKTKKEKPISAIDKRDVKMAALTNLLGNGISRILGIRNLQWSDLEEFADIKKGDVQGIEYKTKGEIKEPQRKDPDAPKTDTLRVVTQIANILRKEGKKTDGKLYTLYTIIGLVDGKETGFKTFSKTIFETVDKEKNMMTLFEIEYTVNKWGNDIINLKVVKPEEPNAEPGV